MLKYILKRILLMLVTLFCITFICFVFIKLLPLPPVSTFGQDANIILQRRELLGYGKPIISQFFIFLERVLVYGDWGVGETLRTGSNVWDVFIEKLPATMVVNLYSIIVSIPIGLALGIYAALKKNKWQDHLISTLVMIFISVPSFVYAFLVQYIFCYRLGWFPFQMDTTGSYLSASTFVSLIPAIMSLAFGSIAGFTRYTRAELSEVLTSDFMLLARTKGLTRGQATMRHALRNSMVVIFPMILGEFVDILSGSLVIEGMFSIPGVGSLYISAINALDYNFFMLLSVFYTFVGLLAGLIVDISYGIIDPRIKMGAK